MRASGTLAADVLIDMIMPFGQFLIGTLVLVTLVVSIRRLLERGPSRMGGAMLLSGGAVIGLALVGYLVQLL
ncbi:hypothetical protein Aab01nite_71050 [Paractinoplanes abujensis]|uniref:Uncharacterized protein n=1 Tax=Paractinoplanes abujensis TaxID=882441 RepID=A0A7W7CU67_9ACTN|nr:hypothetical protein [Actinoplanes abujensis]MBB4694785.1 hypothetical protein [Actinoplanes abujensis]GID23515.1 hypothetical protein Aab01nite_71050 [Actinoplanes abujensis]